MRLGEFKQFLNDIPNKGIKSLLFLLLLLMGLFIYKAYTGYYEYEENIISCRNINTWEKTVCTIRDSCHWGPFIVRTRLFQYNYKNTFYEQEEISEEVSDCIFGISYKRCWINPHSSNVSLSNPNFEAFINNCAKKIKGDYILWLLFGLILFMPTLMFLMILMIPFD